MSSGSGSSTRRRARTCTGHCVIADSFRRQRPSRRSEEGVGRAGAERRDGSSPVVGRGDDNASGKSGSFDNASLRRRSALRTGVPDPNSPASITSSALAIQRAPKLNQEAIPGGLDDASVMLANAGFDEVSLGGLDFALLKNRQVRAGTGNRDGRHLQGRNIAYFPGDHADAETSIALVPAALGFVHLIVADVDEADLEPAAGKSRRGPVPSWLDSSGDPFETAGRSPDGGPAR